MTNSNKTIQVNSNYTITKVDYVQAPFQTKKW